MKVRHMPAALRLYPGFIVRHAHQMMAHTFRGTTWRSVLGLESSREAFRRYKQIRARERTYLDWPDPAPADPDVLLTLGISHKPDPQYLWARFARGSRCYVFPGDRQDLDERHARGLG
jgi:hypothetical protein